MLLSINHIITQLIILNACASPRAVTVVFFSGLVCFWQYDAQMLMTIETEGLRC